jgi:hypothetical protein
MALLPILRKRFIPRNIAYSEITVLRGSQSNSIWYYSWGYHDFPTDFPNGVNFTIGKSDIAKDWNYIHWSVYGPSYTRKNAVWDNMNNWTINFDYGSKINLKRNLTATLTIQLAAAKTAR